MSFFCWIEAYIQQSGTELMRREQCEQCDVSAEIFIISTTRSLQKKNTTIIKTVSYQICYRKV